MTTPTTRRVTVDQMIVQLQKLSWSGKGKYHCFADHPYKERYHSPLSILEVDDENKTVDLTPHGEYYLSEPRL